jgi:hypothetical protein
MAGLALLLAGKSAVQIGHPRLMVTVVEQMVDSVTFLTTVKAE